MDRHALDDLTPGCGNPTYPKGVSESTDDYVVTDAKDASRYELTRNGELVSVIDYRDDGKVLAMTRVFTIPTFRGQGQAARVVEGAVAQLVERGDRKVSPVCWYAAEWFAQHPEHADLLHER